MKFDDLRSIGHNIADSLASGIGLMIGVYEMNIFGEAARSREGFITVDFLNGAATAGKVSPHLARAIRLYRDALTNLCRRHGTSPTAFRELSAQFFPYPLQGGRFVVTVEDQRGRRAIDEYLGRPGKRIRAVDHLGRVRTNRRRYDAPKGL
jgi:hypothetical protein